MSPIKECILNKKTKTKPIWLMRQAGRYLPEFREIRKVNPNFINLCLNENLSTEITLQPIERFQFDAAIIFSDILMLPYGLGQKVEFKKNIGPILSNFNLKDLLKTQENDFNKKLLPIYNAIKKVSKSQIINGKDVIGFVGAPWTLLVYMLNKESPKKNFNNDYLKDDYLINELLKLIDKFLKIHIKNQVDNGATIIQIFDSWAGLVDKNSLSKYIYTPTISLVNFTKSLGVPVICFPRNIDDYKEYVKIVKPDVINIDYITDPKKIINEIDIPIQGGMDPTILLSDKENIKKEALLYLNIFKDHPYIFNLGHGVLPKTEPSNVEFLTKLVKDFS